KLPGFSQAHAANERCTGIVKAGGLGIHKPKLIAGLGVLRRFRDKRLKFSGRLGVAALPDIYQRKIVAGIERAGFDRESRAKTPFCPVVLFSVKVDSAKVIQRFEEFRI